MLLNDYELGIISDTKFLITKYEVITKISAQLDTLNTKINRNIYKYSDLLPEPLVKSTGKISRGENYKHLPYLVLDSPRIFNRHHLMVFRSMFWWGHEFSFTLHLQGDYLHRYFPVLIQHLEEIQQQDVYICVNSQPWEYDFSVQNYQHAHVLTASMIKSHAQAHDFIKISRKLPLTQIEMVPAFGLQTFELFMNWLAPKK